MATISIRSPASGTTQLTNVNLSGTVSELKVQIVAALNIPAEQQRLVFSGHVLQDDKTLASYGIADGGCYPVFPSCQLIPWPVSIHLIKKVASTAPEPDAVPSVPSAQPTSAQTSLFAPTPVQAGRPSAAGAPPGLAALLQDPRGQAMLQQLLSNPQFLEQVMASNPELASNPEALAMLRNPEFLRMMSNPETIRSMISQRRLFVTRELFDTGMTCLNSAPVPAGFPNPQLGNPAARPARTPTQATRTNASTGIPHTEAGQSHGTHSRHFVSNDLLSRALDNALGRSPATTSPASAHATTPTTQTQSTPTAPTQSAPTAPTQSAPTAPAQSTHAAPQHNYTEQLAQLHAMGFTNEAQCLAALRAANGDVNSALAFLFE